MLVTSLLISDVTGSQYARRNRGNTVKPDGGSGLHGQIYRLLHELEKNTRYRENPLRYNHGSRGVALPQMKRLQAQCYVT